MTTASAKKKDATFRAEFFGAAAFATAPLPASTFERIELADRDQRPRRLERAVLIDYGVGNLASIANALDRLGVVVEFSRNPKEILKAEAIILPGVGAFGKAMESLRTSGLVDALEEAINEERLPALGICLGMQVMAQSSTEMGTHAGLGWIDGNVMRVEGPCGLPVPHVGWNTVTAKSDSVLFEGIPAEASFYFDHSYALRESATSVADCDYDGSFVAAIERENVMAVQFHPEKSQISGLRLLANFCVFAAAWMDRRRRES